MRCGLQRNSIIQPIDISFTFASIQNIFYQPLQSIGTKQRSDQFQIVLHLFVVSLA